MDDRQQASDTIMLLEPQPPPVYYPPSPGQSVQQGPYNQGPLPGQAVISVQTAGFVPAAPLPDYLCYSIFNLIFCYCCSPLSIAALVFSLATRNANDAGHREFAVRNSKTARTLNRIACGLGIVVHVFIFVIPFVLYLILIYNIRNIHN